MCVFFAVNLSSSILSSRRHPAPHPVAALSTHHPNAIIAGTLEYYREISSGNGSELLGDKSRRPRKKMHHTHLSPHLQAKLPYDRKGKKKEKKTAKTRKPNKTPCTNPPTCGITSVHKPSGCFENPPVSLAAPLVAAQWSTTWSPLQTTREFSGNPSIARTYSERLEVPHANHSLLVPVLRW